MLYIRAIIKAFGMGIGMISILAILVLIVGVLYKVRGR
jgi:hypothetical protein